MSNLRELNEAEKAAWREEPRDVLKIINAAAAFNAAMREAFRSGQLVEAGEVVEVLRPCVKAMGSAEEFIGSRAKMEKDERAEYAWLLRSACALLSRMEGKP